MRSSSSAQGHEVTPPRGRPGRAGGSARPTADRPPGGSRAAAAARSRPPCSPGRSAPALAARQADVVVATTTGTAVALAAWRRRRRLRDAARRDRRGPPQRPLGACASSHDAAAAPSMHAMLYGPGEAPGLQALDPRLAGRVHVNPFGVDTGVLVAGRDAGRRRPRDRQRRAPRLGDARPRPHLRSRRRSRILTRHPAPAVLPGNVRWEPADWHRSLLSDAEVREAFRAAAAVVVPVKDVPQPSGQSVTLQASACGRPVVLTRTRGLWDPDGLRDGENVLLVPPGDPDALADAVGRVLADPELAAGDRSLGTDVVEARSERRGLRGAAARRSARQARRASLSASTVRGRWHSGRSRAPRSCTPARLSATSPRACGRSAISARPAPGAPTSRSSTRYAPPPSGGGQPVPPRARGRAPSAAGWTVEENRISGGTHALPLQLVQLRPRAAPALRPRRRPDGAPRRRADRRVPRIRRRHRRAGSRR